MKDEYIKDLPDVLTLVNKMDHTNIVLIVIGVFIWKCPEIIKAIKMKNENK